MISILSKPSANPARSAKSFQLVPASEANCKYCFLALLESRSRAIRSRSPTHKNELFVSHVPIRLNRLMSLGYSMEEIATAALASQKVRQEREESMQKEGWDKFAFVLGSATRKLKKLVANKPPAAIQTTVVSRSA